jgi:hypothetical protein
MPSKSAKQHRFMEAIAHNPAFAKKVGVPQTVGKDFSAADKGRRFAAGGVTKQKINKQDTKHGVMDMPFSSLKKYTGMKSGGVMKRYAEGGVLERLGEPQSFKDAFREARDNKVATFTWNGKKYSTALASPKKDTTSDARESARHATFGKTPEVASEEELKLAKEWGDKEDREARRERMMQGAGMAMGAAGAAGVGRAVARMIASRGMGRGASQAMEKAAQGTQRQTGPVRQGMERIREREAAQAAARREAALDAERASAMEAGYRKGGSVKESKAMVKKEVEFFKKKGAPASMIKHEKAEMKGMKRGGMTMRPKKDIARDQMGMAPYARGGGIESKGKTKGTMIRMASGGFVRSADGIASKGKTKGKMC